MSVGEEIPSEARKLQSFLRQLIQDLDPDCVMIGGWAVVAYQAKDYSLDGDIMVSYAVQGTLRDQFELTKNPRMKKEQFIAPTGHDIDVYVDHQHGLPVPFTELQAYSRIVDGIRVPCPEHLLVLKLRAALDRQHSGKGLKDRQDLLGLLLLKDADYENPEVLASFFVKEDWDNLRALATEREALQRWCGGNSWEASKVERKVKDRIQWLDRAPQLSDEKNRTPGEARAISEGLEGNDDR